MRRADIGRQLQRRQAQPPGVAPRMGWMAMNLFFNTGFDDHNQLVSDEPWSRPGDYVLLRAEMDCVIAFSACPQDMVPINGVACLPTEAHCAVV